MRPHNEQEHAALALQLHRIGAVRFGSFALKDGSTSPFYVDLRVVIGHPDVLRSIAQAMLRRAAALEYDCLAGIPYAGLPLAVAMSLESGRPLVYPRKETKAYGTQRQVEGVFTAGERALVIDDVITTGGAKIEAIAPLRAVGLVVQDIVVVVDRQQSGAQTLAAAGLRLHSVLTIDALFEALERAGAINADDLARARRFREQQSP
jgi:uridine monophosphate synthetase